MPPCNGDCNQGRECNCGCKMTKDEALRMALRWITDVSTNNEDEVIQACKEALAQPSNMVTIPLDKLEDMQRRLKEPTVVELNDEYLRDTHVEGMPKDGDCCTEGCIKCDARKILAETQEPFDVVQDSKGNLVPLYTTPPPSREWVGLSEAEIGELWYKSQNDVEGVNLGFTTQEHFFAGLIDAKLREINGW